MKTRTYGVVKIQNSAKNTADVERRIDEMLGKVDEKTPAPQIDEPVKRFTSKS